ncbi:MAG: helix-turn-helix transcriptional regulator [Lachnospiraceae bacterium]
MELYTQIKKYRTSMNLSQEELAEKVYVTRQTISNWETNKNYPDIHSLLLLSSLFNISLDQLIKGDINIMKEEINKTELQKFNRDSTIFTVLLILMIISAVPLAALLSYYGWIIWGLLVAITMYFAIKIEKYKKDNDIQTFKEIISFTEGKRLDEIERNQEYGKRPYQKALLAFACAIIAFLVCMVFGWLLNSFIL